MSTTDPTTAVVLDGEQREALRRELRLAALDCGDINVAINQGDRTFVLGRLDLLASIAAVLDAVGWAEQPGAPDRQPVAVPPEAAAWLAANADALTVSLHEAGGSDLDSDLLALAVMRELAARA